jgi:hypothetical protein
MAVHVQPEFEPISVNGHGDETLTIASPDPVRVRTVSSRAFASLHVIRINCLLNFKIEISEHILRIWVRTVSFEDELMVLYTSRDGGLCSNSLRAYACAPAWHVKY